MPLEGDDLDPYFLLLVVAGNETTRNLLSGLVVALDEHPGEADRLRAGTVSSVNAVKEMLRYVSPVLCMRRTATADVELHGRTVEAGQKVVGVDLSDPEDIDRALAEVPERLGGVANVAGLPGSPRRRR